MEPLFPPTVKIAQMIPSIVQEGEHFGGGKRGVPNFATLISVDEEGADTKHEDDTPNMEL